MRATFTIRPLLASLATAAILTGACTSAAPTPSSRPAGSAAAAASPRASISATPASPKEQAIEIVGKFALQPSHGPWGTVVAAIGTALRPGARYDILWTSVNGSWTLSADRTEFKGRAYAPVESMLGTVTADASGAFRTTFTVPSEFGFQHDVLVKDTGGAVIRNKAGFDVDLEVSITPTSGPVGTPIAIEARGIGWRQMENSWLASYDNQFTGWLSAVTTKGVARAVIPASGAPGVHVLTILHGDFTFPYLNMQQSPEPDRPMFHLPFTVTDGTPVLPAPAERQGLAILPAQPVDRGIWASPRSGTVGQSATFFGRGFPANSEVTLTWTNMQGNRVATGYDEVTKDLGRTRSDAAGTFSFPFTVPNDLGGAHKVVALAAGALVAQSEFVIQPRAFALTPAHGPSGTPVEVHLQGVGWTETANIYNLTVDNGYAGYACGFNSGGDVTVKMVISGDRGWHFIDLYPGIYKGTETRPLNFRVPQLTYAADHPGEDLPAFHFAFFID